MDSFPTGRRARTIDGAVRVFQDRDLNSAMKSEVPQGVVLHLGVASEVGGREWVEATLPDGTSGYVLGANVRSHTTTADSGGDDDSMLEWSVQPGFHERRLLLRHNNLFFPPERRSVSKHELSSAKQMDAEMFKRFEESAQLTIALFLQQREHYEIREAAKLQREVEETVNLGSGLGLGARDLLRPLKAGCDALAAQVETAMIAGSPNDESAIRRHANLLRTLYDFERHQAYIDVSRAEPTDRLPTLLSCSAEDLRFLFQELPPELADVSKAWQTSKEELRTFAIQLMHESPEAKSKLLQERGKLALLGISIPLSPRFREASSRVRSLGARLEELFVQQYDRFAFHNDDKENDYRLQEDRLSTLMVDNSITDEKRREYAEALVGLSDRYKAVVLQGLHTLNDEIHRELVSFEQTLDAMPSTQTEEDSAQVADLRRWLSLSKDLHQARLMGAKSICLRVDLDRVIPNVVLKNNGQKDTVLTGEEAQTFQDGLSEAIALAKKSFEDNQQIQKEREPLSKFFVNSREAAPPEKVEGTVNPPPRPPSKLHPLEAKSWFRLVKVLYICLWVGGAGLCIVLAIATESAAWFIGSAFVLVLVLIVLKRAFYYVTLGRTTATEVPGTGFLDLDELRNEFTGLEANDPKLYQELVAPYLDSWKTQFGRRVPLQAYEAFRKRIDNEINAIQEKKQKLIDDAAKKGATLDIAALRKSMEKSKSEYKGADRQDYAREIDAWLIRLEAKYGASIPVDEASRILDELEAGMREKERQPPSSLRKEIGKHSAIALWFQQRANSQQSATSLTYREFVQWFLGLKLVGDAEVQLQVFADGIRSYYQDITQTLGKDCLNAFSPTDNIPNEAKAMLAESKGLTWVKMAESALTKMWDLENDFQRRADPTALELIRLLLHANDLMDIGTFLRAEDRVIELRGVCYALIRESEKANDAELAQGVVTYCALRNALRASPGLRQYIGL